MLVIAFIIYPMGDYAAYAQEKAVKKPKITGVRILNFSSKDKKADFTIEITGEVISVGVLNKDVTFYNSAGVPAAELVKLEADGENRLKVTASADVPSELTRIKVKTAETTDFKLSIKEEEGKQKAIEDIEIKYEVFRSVAFPNQFTLFVTKQAGGGVFAIDPRHMRVEVLPAGATDVRIRPGSNPEHLVIDFLAPEKFEIKGVVVTVYDNGDFDNPVIKAIAKPFKEKTPKADPNQHTISRAEIVFIQRSKGYGRMKIEGSGFGNFPLPPLTTEEFFSCCAPKYKEAQASSQNDSGGSGGGHPLIEFLEREAEDLKSAKGADRQEREKSLEALKSLVANYERDQQEKTSKWPGWRDQINEKIKVELMPRNPDLRVERTEVFYINDKLINVYFEFTHFKGYSQPFRLDSATVTVNKPGVKTLQLPLKSGGAVMTLDGPETFWATKEVGPKKDENLQYQHTVLTRDQARNLFGEGVAKHFYVIQLSVVNNGAKKVAVPLASIQAEIEWGHGRISDELEFLEGPVTIAPLPLQAVSGFFDADIKSRGRKAKILNIMDGITTLGAALIPIFGPGFKDGHVIYTGGLIPGVRKAIGDLSGQQLQNLTGLSWENVEVLPSGGGSVNKFIYVQRGEWEFSTFSKGGVKPDIKKEIKNILGLEVVGFELTESEAKKATEQ
jgi:hypothetical protein